MTAQRWIRILLSALVLLASAARTWAVCDDIRWDETERQFSVYGDGDVCTLQDILDEYPDTDALIKVDGDEGIWFLDADLLIRTGATLQLHGADADGTTNRLYFSSSDGNYHAIDASWGILSIQSTEIFGWDMSSGDISDVEGTGEYHRYYDDGRSYIKARSRLDDSGPNDVSTLIVKTSELAYLGFNKGESYGLSASVEDSADCSTTALRVYAVIQGNQIHHTYRGFSGLCLTSETSMVTGNEISDVAEDAVHLANNINYVVVNSNYIDASGDVAVSCGDSCNYLTVSNNILSNNEVAIELDSDVENATVSDNTIRYSREKGIELRDVEDSSISSNQIFCTGGSEGTACGSVLYEGTASGIHIISSYNNQVDENSIVSGQRGISVSGDSAVNTVENNRIEGQEGYGLFVYLSDTDETSTGPRANSFNGNTFTDNAGGIFFLESERNDFSDNNLETAEDASVLVRSSNADRFTFSAFVAPDDDEDARLTLRVRGESDSDSLVWLYPTDDMDMDLSLDQYSEVAMVGSRSVWSFKNKGGVVSTTEPGADLMYLSALSGVILITGALQEINLTIESDDAVDVHVDDLIEDGSSWIVTPSEDDQVVAMELSDMTVSSTWALYKDGENLGNLLSGTDGVVNLEDTLTEADEPVTYRIQLVSSNADEDTDTSDATDSTTDSTDSTTDSTSNTSDSDSTDSDATDTTSSSSVEDGKSFGSGAFSIHWLLLLVLLLLPRNSDSIARFLTRS